MAYPVLAEGYTWWKPNVSTVTRVSITEIEILDSYTPDSSVTVVDSWDASNAQDGSITCYVIGTKLIIAGNGSGKIAANANSNMMFTSDSSNSADYFTKVTSILGAGLLDVSNVVDASNMFAFCYSLRTLDVSEWNTSKMETTELMFYGCNVLPTLNVANWDMSKVLDMSEMFRDCKVISGLDVSKWNTSNVRKMFSMFSACSFATIDVSNWDISMVEDVSRMFSQNTALVAIDISKWYTPCLTTCSEMFFGCSALKHFNAAGWNTSNVSNTSFMFYGCTSLECVDFSNWDTTNVTTMANMFASCRNLKKITVGPNFSISGKSFTLPTPSATYIPGADGKWYAFNGDAYAPNAIKNKTAETYFASLSLCADQDVIVKNGSLINAAKAIREKNGTTTHYSPAQFGAAIRSL